MERVSDLTAIGDIMDEVLRGFWKPNTKEEEAAKYAGRSDVYTDAQGIVRCKKCREPRMFLLKEANRWLPCACSCAGKETDADFSAKVAELRAASGLSGRYARADFDRFEQTDDNRAAMESCLHYAMRFEQVRKRGLGIYLHGSSGTGKTYLAACIGNMLLDAAVQVLFVNVNTILSEIRYAYSQRGSELPTVRKYTNADFVIFDDVGTEKYSSRTEAMSFAQDKFFQIIDGRYIGQKPTVFTSNYTLEQLVDERGMLVKTVDRIAEMSTRKFELKGKPRRSAQAQDIPF